MSLHVVFFYLTLFLLPTQLGFHTWPDWALVLGRRIDYLSPTLFLTDITIVLTLLSWMITKRKEKRTPQLPLSKRHIIFWSIVTFAVCTNICFSISPIISFFKWIKIIEFVVFGYYIYKTKPSFRTSIIVFSIAALYSSLLAITQFILQRSVGGIMWFLGERTFNIMTAGIARVHWCWFGSVNCSELLRPYATFSHPNVLGGLLAIVIYCIFLTLRNEKIKSVRIWFYGVLGFSIVALFLSFSRSAWIISLLAAILFFAFTFRKPGKKIILVFCFFLFVVLFITVPYFFALTPTNESMFVRYDLALTAIQLFFAHPFSGTGLGTFLVELPRVALTRDLFFLQPVHNIFLLWIAETGLVGMFIVGIAIKKYVHYLFSHKKLIRYAFPVIFLLCIGLVDHYPTTIQQGQLFFTVLITLPFLYFKNT